MSGGRSYDSAEVLDGEPHETVVLVQVSEHVRPDGLRRFVVGDEAQPLGQEALDPDVIGRGRSVPGGPHEPSRWLVPSDVDPRLDGLEVAHVEQSLTVGPVVAGGEVDQFGPATARWPA